MKLLRLQHSAGGKGLDVNLLLKTLGRCCNSHSVSKMYPLLLLKKFHSDELADTGNNYYTYAQASKETMCVATHKVTVILPYSMN